MGSYGPSNSQFRQFPGALLHRLEPYKVDEGYSEETRSSDGSESSMRLDLPKGGEEVMQPPLSASFEHLIRGLSEYERGGGSTISLSDVRPLIALDIAYDLLRGLKASSIARIFDRLWPLFHKDPLEVFPPEIMSLVLSYLEPHDLLTVSLVSGAWRERVTDSNLWRKKFSIEGWSLDAGEISRLENILQRPASPERRRRSTQLPFERRMTPNNNVHSQSAAQSSQEFMSDVVPLKDRISFDRSSSNEEMVDLDGSQMEIDPLQTPQNSPIKPTSRTFQSPYIPSDDQSSLVHYRRPLIITSTPGYSRINYHYIFKQKRRLEDNWDKGCYQNFQLPHRDAPHEAHEECVYTIQYQGNYLVSGSRDKTLRIWNLSTSRLMRQPLKGHVGSVLCLQFDSRPEEDLIVSGSSDTNVILWQFSTGEMIKKISEAHSESVLNLRFDHRYLVTCSKDKTIKIWNRHQLRPGDPEYPKKGHAGGGQCPAYILNDPVTTEIPRWLRSHESHLMELEPYMHLMTLSLHGAAVNAIQIYQDQLVSASGDRTLRVWDIHTGQSLSKIAAHEKGIACVQYDGKRIVSGSSDNSIRIWDPASKTEVARLEGHTRLVRTLQAAFADVPGGREKLEAEAAEIDRQWETARDHGEDLHGGRGARPHRPGSRRPRNLRAVGAKIPPSGGGSRWARIVSGSYDEKVIVWKKNADDEWVINHLLAQEEALTAAGPPILTRSQVNSYIQPEARTSPPIAPIARPPNPPPSQVENNPTPTAPPSHPPLALAPPPFNPAPPIAAESDELPVSSQPAQMNLPSTDDVSNDHPMAAAQKTPRRSGHTPDQTEMQAVEATSPPPTQTTTRRSARPNPSMPAPIPNTANNANRPTPQAVALAASRHPQLPATQPNARVFKLQFDARRIICCSQDNKIVGWDFANGDEDIMACSKFFADPQ